MSHPIIRHIKRLIPQAAKDLYGRIVEGRSHHWPATRRAWLKQHGFCRACGRNDHLQVHHKRPFHLHPELELDPSNFITLCENTPEEDHLKIGHHDDWKNFNPNVEEDSDKAFAERKVRK